MKIYNFSGHFIKNIGNNDEIRKYINIFEINENKYIVSGGNKGIIVFILHSLIIFLC